jgi:hypothetical protein
MRGLDITVFRQELRNYFSEGDINDVELVREGPGKSGFPALGFTDYENSSHWIHVLRDRQVHLEQGRVPHHRLPLLLVLQVVNTLVVDQWGGSEVLDEGEGVELAEPAFLDDEVVEEVWDPVSFNGQHVVLLPLLHPVLDVVFERKSDLVSHVLHLPVTINLYHFDV